MVAVTWGFDKPLGPSYDEMLKKFDKDGDGKLSKEEMKASIGEEFGAGDFNNDGFMDRAEYDKMQAGGLGEHGLVAVKLGGRGDLTKTAVLWNNRKNYPTVPSVLVYKGVLYFVKTGGIVASMDPVTGEIYKLDRTKQAIEDYYASPVAAD